MSAPDDGRQFLPDAHILKVMSAEVGVGVPGNEAEIATRADVNTVILSLRSRAHGEDPITHVYAFAPGEALAVIRMLTTALVDLDDVTEGP